jgi:hypothetical protein
MVMKKAEIQNKILEEHGKLEKALARIDPTCMEASESDESWTVKETLVHITAWEQVLLADYARLLRGETIHELGSDAEINALNAKTRAAGKDMPLPQALAEFASSFRQIIAWLGNLPETELDRPFAYGMTLGEFIGEDTWKHYSEHLEIFLSGYTNGEIKQQSSL